MDSSPTRRTKRGGRGCRDGPRGPRSIGSLEPAVALRAVAGAAIATSMAASGTAPGVDPGCSSTCVGMSVVKMLHELSRSKLNTSPTHNREPYDTLLYCPTSCSYRSVCGTDAACGLQL